MKFWHWKFLASFNLIEISTDDKKSTFTQSDSYYWKRETLKAI